MLAPLLLVIFTMALHCTTVYFSLILCGYPLPFPLVCTAVILITYLIRSTEETVSTTEEILLAIFNNFIRSFVLLLLSLIVYLLKF